MFLVNMLISVVNGLTPSEPFNAFSCHIPIITSHLIVMLDQGKKKKKISEPLMICEDLRIVLSSGNREVQTETILCDDLTSSFCFEGVKFFM